MKQKLKVQTPITRVCPHTQFHVHIQFSWPQISKVTFTLGISSLWLISLSRFKIVSLSFHTAEYEEYILFSGE